MGNQDSEDALLAAGFAAAAGGLSGVALAASSNASSGASPGLSLGQLVAPAGVCDDAGALLGVVGAACQAGTAVLPPPWLLLSLCPLPGEREPARAGREQGVRAAGKFSGPHALFLVAADVPPEPSGAGLIPPRAQNVRTGRMIRLRRVAFLLPSALRESLDSSQSPYSAWSVRILRAASRASRDVPRGRYTTR